VIPQVVERVSKGVHCAQVRGVSLHEQVVKGILDVCGEFQGIVVGGPEDRLPHAELFLDPLT
jgi:hypothetical protein